MVQLICSCEYIDKIHSHTTTPPTIGLFVPCDNTMRVIVVDNKPVLPCAGLCWNKNSKKLLEKVALCSAWITHDTDIDISSQVCAFLCNFMNAAKQHQQNSTFHLIIACNDSSSAVL